VPFENGTAEAKDDREQLEAASLAAEVKRLAGELTGAVVFTVNTHEESKYIL
jgi:hypothetical protein